MLVLCYQFQLIDICVYYEIIKTYIKTIKDDIVSCLFLIYLGKSWSNTNGVCIFSHSNTVTLAFIANILHG